MSRLKRFTHSLLSGYLLLGSNVFFTLASIPLALHYLTKSEFGLWALVMQVTSYLQLVDLGMVGSLSRILIDHKDDRSSSRYGEVIQTGVKVLFTQGILVAALGGLLAYCLPPLMNIPAEYWGVLRWLMTWQCVIAGTGFTGRIFSLILEAHQRFDLCNYAGVAAFGVNLLSMWMALSHGWGFPGMVVASAASVLCIWIWCAVAAVRLRLLPERGQWGRSSWTVFWELFSYGANIFLLSVGNMMVGASQLPIITRTLGLEAAAAWSVGTKLFMLTQQLIYRLFDYSSTPLAEMMVRGERPRLFVRFRDLVIVTASASAFACVGAALCNQSFLAVWVHQKIAWGTNEDVSLGAAMLIYAITRCHIGLTGLTKDIRGMKIVSPAEGVAFIIFSLLSTPHFGLLGVIISGAVTNLLFSGTYGVWRTAQYFGLPTLAPLTKWLKMPVCALMLAVLVGLTLWLFTRHLTMWPRLLVQVVGFLLIGGSCFWRFGIPIDVRSEIKRLVGTL